MTTPPKPDLATVAARAGLIDSDLLKIARTDLPPKAAVADLRKRYPGAFPVDARDLSETDFQRALSDRGWRKPKNAPATPPADRSKIMAMNETEFRDAMRRRAWRTA